MANTESYGSWHADNEFQPHTGGSGTINVGQTERMISVGLGAFLLSSGYAPVKYSAPYQCTQETFNRMTG